MKIDELSNLANKLRLKDLQSVFHAGAGHIGGEMSVMDVLTAFYFHVLSIDPDNPKDLNRDRFVLSKGHTANALYVVLAERGFISKDEIKTFLKPYSALNGHPNCVKVAGVETNTGPLGHGLPVAVGMAKGAKLDKAKWRTFVITGDGEMQEGSNWEAMMTASQFKLDNLSLIIDHNRLQQGARVDDTNSLSPLVDKIKAFGWAIEEIDGHDMQQICHALSERSVIKDKPKCIIAHTNKGQGISFMNDDVAWHHKVPNQDQYEQATLELKEKIV